MPAAPPGTVYHHMCEGGAVATVTLRYDPMSGLLTRLSVENDLGRPVSVWLVGIGHVLDASWTVPAGGSLVTQPPSLSIGTVSLGSS